MFSPEQNLDWRLMLLLDVICGEEQSGGAAGEPNTNKEEHAQLWSRGQRDYSEAGQGCVLFFIALYMLALVWFGFFDVPIAPRAFNV